MSTTNKLQILILCAVCALGGYFFGLHQVSVELKNYKPSLQIINREPPTGSSTDFSLFWQVYDKLNSEYYDKKVLDPQKEEYGAISGMVQSLGDPFTMF